MCRWDITDKNIMKKNIKRLFKIVIAAALAMTFLTSCEEGFSEGFRQGWNSTAPPEYRY